MKRTQTTGRGLLAGALVGTMAALGLSLPAGADSHEAGTNVALATNGGEVTASGQELAGRWGPALAIDGVTSGTSTDPQASRWSSNTADDAWIQVELDEPTGVHHVTLYWEAACARQYRLQTSTDGETWTDATGVVEPRCGTVDRQTLDVEGPVSFVRMQGIDRTPIGGTEFGISLWELQVWDGPEVVLPEALDIVPRPVSVDVDDDADPFILDSTSQIVAAGEAADSGEMLADIMRPSTGFELPVVDEPGDGGDITLQVGPEHAVPGHTGNPEAYTLEADEDGITVSATDAHGVFNGVQTLRQLFPSFIEYDEVTSGPWAVPAVSILDAPRFDYRGIMLDVARSFQTVDEVKQYIDALVQFKMNHLHLHLADDQGWRIEITNEGRVEGDDIDYTRLTSISGGTAMTEQGYNDEPGRTGFYTQEDYAEIVDYAAERHVVIVPEIDTPGHTQAALHAIPQLNTEGAAPEPDPATGVPPSHGTGEVGHSTLDTRNEVTYTFLEHVWSQIAEMTPGPYLHVGGDESHVTEEEDYIYFMDRMIDVVEDLGKEPFGWNELALADVHEGNVIQFWAANTAGAELAPERVNENGAKMIVSDSARAYLDQRYDGDDPNDPNDSVSPIGLSWACRDNCTVERYYDWDPQALFPDVNAEGFLGVEGPLWSETVRGIDQALWLVLPRAAALLEIGWTEQDQRLYDDFAGRLASLGGRLTLQDHNFYATPEIEWTVDVAGIDQQVEQAGTATEMTLGVATAPGTTAEEISGTVDFGDGSDPVPVIVTATREGDELHVNGEYLLSAEHTFAAPGTYTGMVTTTGPNGTATAPVTFDVAYTPSIVLDDDEVQAGEDVGVTLAGFMPGAPIVLSLDGTVLATVDADDEGGAVLEVTIPATTAAGAYELTARQGTLEVGAMLTVTAAPAPTPTDPSPTDPSPTDTGSPAPTDDPTHRPTPPRGGGLPNTGAEVGAALLAGLVLLAAGGAILLRRRLTR
ncbi:family 20 glycosylhydrolase [Georgenia faecalis]|uniref:family 20 glycosylhydrolase n=1 Tax=Georgenia faecalis TaxID=2483799 RepID=UPI0013DF77DE|nr:family 20 glycosylhydrolase [Georgenia faecalis]